MSAIISRRLLDGPIAKHGIQAQFGSQPFVGCRDAIYTIRSMLQMRRHHNLPTWAQHVDLVKAFNTANHELLFKLLSKFGVPDLLVDVIRRLYHDTDKIKVGKEERMILYLVGVKQGDNMAPVLFLFLMQAMAEEALEGEWKENDLDTPQFRHILLCHFQFSPVFQFSQTPHPLILEPERIALRPRLPNVPCHSDHMGPESNTHTNITHPERT
jgi:hypothetical protein